MLKRLKMKYILSLFVLLLTGCGTSGSSSSVELLGTWTLACTNNSSGDSEQGILLVREHSLEFNTKRYYNMDCNEDDLYIHFIRGAEYTIGEGSKFSNGIAGRELNLIITSDTIVNDYSIFEQEDDFVGTKVYTMYNLENKKLCFADLDKERDGLSISQRINLFSNKYYIKDN